MLYNFEWDPNKAKSNHKKHGISFEQATAVFRDPKALSLYDNEHSDTEERWVTLGLLPTGITLVVHHTYHSIDEGATVIRIISSRKATRREQQQYRELKDEGRI
ncbi:MAG: BrnT family toxin [Proteobacteria bacterium]|nr:BrnT family toxin [Pseudomonadota bacterium]